MKDVDAKKEEGGMSEDDIKFAKTEVQRLIDEANQSLEEVFSQKEAIVLGK